MLSKTSPLPVHIPHPLLHHSPIHGQALIQSALPSHPLAPYFSHLHPHPYSDAFKDISTACTLPTPTSTPFSHPRPSTNPIGTAIPSFSPIFQSSPSSPLLRCFQRHLHRLYTSHTHFYTILPSMAKHQSNRHCHPILRPHISVTSILTPMLSKTSPPPVHFPHP